MCGLIACSRYPHSGHGYVAGFGFCARRIAHQFAGSSRGMRRLEARVSGHLDTYVGERDDRAVGAPRRARHAADRLAVVHELRVKRWKLVELEHPQASVPMPAVIAPRPPLLP